MHRRALLTTLAAGAAFAPRVFAADPSPDLLGFRPDPVFLEKAIALLKTHAAIDTQSTAMSRTPQRRPSLGTGAMSAFQYLVSGSVIGASYYVSVVPR